MNSSGLKNEDFNFGITFIQTLFLIFSNLRKKLEIRFGGLKISKI